MEKEEFEKTIPNKIEEGTLIYVLKEKDILGYGFIKKVSKNPICVYVLDKYRGNGYGTILFRNLLDVIKKNSIDEELQDKKEIYFTLSKEEGRIHRIIRRSGGMVVFEDGNSVSYVLPLEV